MVFGKILFAQEAETGQQIGAAPQRQESGRRIYREKGQPQIEKQRQKKDARAAGTVTSSLYCSARRRSMRRGRLRMEGCGAEAAGAVKAITFLGLWRCTSL